jgi:hypothetical protein
MNCSDEREHEEEILEAEGRVIVGIYGLVVGIVAPPASDMHTNMSSRRENRG